MFHEVLLSNLLLPTLFMMIFKSDSLLCNIRTWNRVITCLDFVTDTELFKLAQTLFRYRCSQLLFGEQENISMLTLNWNNRHCSGESICDDA
jgi:hypothetical protein